MRGEVGTASSAPLLLTIVISSVPLPKELIGPDVELSVALFVPTANGLVL